jgi:hypothetical protein
VIERPLLELLSDHRARDLAVRVRHGAPDALSAVARGIAVAQLERFPLTGRRAGRHRRPAGRAAGERDRRFDGGIAARIQNLPGVHVRDVQGMLLSSPS